MRLGRKAGTGKGDFLALKVGGEGGLEIGSRTVTVKDRFEVDPEKPLPEYNVTPALAYSCKHRRDNRRSLMALVCDPKLPRRLSIVGVVQRISSRNFLRVVDWGVADWSPEGRRCPIIIFERPGGAKVFKTLKDTRAPMTEERVTRQLIQPVALIMNEMHRLGIYHRAIRPDNLFFDDKTEEVMLLGDCFVSPPGVTQPGSFEPLDTALATPFGRGEGTSQHDLFSLGVTILSLLAGKVPHAETPEEDLLKARLQLGSYSVLASSQRVSLTMMEPLRGLLNDDPLERWTLDDLSLWLNGRRLSPKQQAMPTKASRSFTFMGRECAMTREVAHAFQTQWDKATIAVQDGSLDTWLRRSLGEDDMVEAVNEAKASAAHGPGEEGDRLVAKVISALDPDGPIRLKDLSTTLDGLGTLLGGFYHDRSARTLFVNVVDMGIAHFWANQQRKVTAEQVRQMTRLDRVKTNMKQTALGFGMERVIYDMNPDLPCMSKAFERDYVPTIDFIMPAFERIAAENPETTRFVDRDVAAFLTVHFKRPLSTEFREIDKEGDSSLGRIAQMRVLASIQEALFKGSEFPHLCTVGATILAPAIERFNSRTTQKKMKGRLKKAAKSGRVQDLLDVVDDRNVVNQDEAAFNKAQAEYATSVVELIKARRDRLNKDAIAQNIGGELAMTMSIGLSFISGIIGLVVFLF